MTELIVALDGPNPQNTLADLYHYAEVRWFKIGPQAMTSPHWYYLINYRHFLFEQSMPGVKIFLDLKLAETQDTVTETIKRSAEAGVNAVSTFTRQATEAALRAAEGTELQVWEVIALTDKLPILNSIYESWIAARDRITDQHLFRHPHPHGMICPGFFAEGVRKRLPNGVSKKLVVIVPGVRLPLDKSQADNHFHSADASTLPLMGATYAIVGRPIWNSSDPVGKAIAYKEALKDTTSVTD